MDDVEDFSCFGIPVPVAPWLNRPAKTLVELRETYNQICEALSTTRDDRERYELLRINRWLYHFFEDYLDTDLPLDSLESDLVDLFGWLLSETPKTVTDILGDLYCACRMAKQYAETKARHRINALQYSVQQKALQLFYTHGLDERTGDAFTGCIFFSSFHPGLLRTVISMLPGLPCEWRAKTVEALKSSLTGSRQKLEYIDAYLELDELFHKLQRENNEKFGELARFTEDAENVHAVRIESDVLDMLEVVEQRFAGIVVSFDSLLEDPELWETLRFIEEDPTDFHGKTLKGWLALTLLWAETEGHMETLIEELTDMKGKCPSGHFRRLINVFNGILFNLELSGERDDMHREFFDYVNTLIAESPDMDEILGDMETKGKKFVDEIVRDMMPRYIDWGRLMRARRAYLYAE